MIFENVDPRALVINEAELTARLSAPTDAERGNLSALYESLIAVARPAYVAERVKVNTENGRLYVGTEGSDSLALGKFLKESSECAVMVATLGVGVDRLILKRAHTSAAEAFILDALADAMIESLCDLVEKRVREGETSSRFSPGYADLELGFGRAIIALTDAERRLGVKLTESGLMVPKKSVNAIIALR